MIKTVRRCRNCRQLRPLVGQRLGTMELANLCCDCHPIVERRLLLEGLDAAPEPPDPNELNQRQRPYIEWPQSIWFAVVKQAIEDLDSKTVAIRCAAFAFFFAPGAHAAARARIAAVLGLSAEALRRHAARVLGDRFEAAATEYELHHEQSGRRAATI